MENRANKEVIASMKRAEERVDALIEEGKEAARRAQDMNLPETVRAKQRDRVFYIYEILQNLKD